MIISMNTLEDDPASYKMKGDDFVDEEERRMPVPVENTFHELLESSWVCLISTTKEYLIARNTLWIHR